MNVLIKSAKIIDTESEFHNKIQDVLIEKGKISKISTRLKNLKNYKEIVLDNLHISQGWFDSSICFGEPGYEERETLSNGLSVAAKSGFTAVAVNSNTNPVIETNTDITFLKSKAEKSPVNVYPIGALTRNSKGEALAELFDMKNAGAISFYDYQKPIQNANLMKIALQYSDTFGGLICAYPQDISIARNGVMSEGITSTTIGLKGIPDLAETLQIERDLNILEYTGGKLHIPTISTAKSVDLIRKAKKNKLNVSCSVAIHNIILDDSHLTDFDSNFKVSPPLRTQHDIDALIEGLKDGTIDMVTSDHNPLDIELKKLEFDHAINGTIGLESAFGALNSVLTTKASIKQLVNGKARFGIESSPIKEGEKANMTLFNPDIKYTFGESYILSKSKNAIFKNTPLKGKAYGIINNNTLVL